MRGGLRPALLAVLAACASLPAAALELGAPFGDHMVLQRGVPVPVWGTAAPGAVVRVRLRDQRRETTADAAGRWRVALAPLAAGGPEVLRVEADASRALEDVLVGEVWLGSGQSNMAATAGQFARHDPPLAALLEAAPYPELRLLTSGAGRSWRRADRAAARAFSAQLLVFGVALRAELGVPVGLMVAAQETTELVRWLDPDAAAADPALRAARAEGRASAPVGDLYAERVRPLAPYALRGVLWDQGENGVGVPNLFAPVALRALVEGWRRAWRADWPFLYQQKPSGGGCAFDPRDPLHARAAPFAPLPAAQPEVLGGWLRSQYPQARGIPGVHLVPNSDLGGGLHPRDKSSYAARAAAVALASVYGRGDPVEGPEYAGHRVEGDAVRVRFAHADSGLVFRHGDRLQGFALAGADGVFHWARAHIEGDSVVVHSDAVPEPVAVRYAFAAEHPWANLFNAVGLPALAFQAR